MICYKEKARIHGDTLFMMVHVKVAPRYFEDFSRKNVRQRFAKAVWVHDETDGTGSDTILSQTELSAFVQK